MDQRIAKQVIHMYTLNKCSVLFCSVLYSVVITRQSNRPISKFSSPCIEFKCFWSMFVYNVLSELIEIRLSKERVQVSMRIFLFRQFCKNQATKSIKTVLLYLYNLCYFSDIDECLSNPCLNGATCDNEENHFTCNCTDDWQGTRCDQGEI